MRFGTLSTVILASVALQAAEPTNLKNDREKLSYGIGMNIANSLKSGQYDLDIDLLSAGIKDYLAGRTNVLTQEEAQKLISGHQNEIRQKMADARKKQGDENKKAGDAFREENKKKPGVKSTASGLQYRVIVEGKGEVPKPTDTVNAHYRGRLIDGTEFDSSFKRNQPFKTAVSSGIIKGWTEALQLMPVGSKWEVVLPPDIAYGERGGGPIGPNATLIFELELLSIEPRVAAPAAGEPVTSDIIKVPSAEELKKGAKIEVLKKEDVEKLQKQPASKQQPK